MTPWLSFVGGVGFTLSANLACSLVPVVGDDQIPAGLEVVMAPGSKLVAVTPVGEIQVAAGKGLQRCYSWEGATRCVEMRPRRKRWQGSLGIYFPGSGYHWSGHRGIARAVVEEGQQHFRTQEEALDWIHAQRRWISVVYRNDGLLVASGKNLERKQLNVEVWQLLVAGVRPRALSGADDQKINVIQPE